MTDPVLGQITVSEAVALSAEWDHAIVAADHIAVVAGQARTLHRNGAPETGETLAYLEGVAQGHLVGLKALKASTVVAVLTDPAAPVEPEPPITEPPVVEPPIAIEGYGCDESLIDETWELQYGGTPGDKAMHAVMDHGGTIQNKRILGDYGHGYCLSTLGGAPKPLTEVRNCLLLPNHLGAKGSGTRRYGNRIQDRNNTIRSPGLCKPDGEQHPCYDNPFEEWILDYLRIEEMAGNVQGTYRPSEGGGFVHYVRHKLLIINGHAPTQSGNKSAMAGPLDALYNLAPDCDADIDLIVRQTKWAQWGPFLSCVPGKSAAETDGSATPWWKPGDYTHGKLKLRIDFEGKRPEAQECLRMSGGQELDFAGQLKLTDSATPIAIFLDQPMYGVLGLKQVRIDLDVRGPAGEPVACPIYRGVNLPGEGKPVAYTTDGKYVSGVPIGGH